MGSMIETVAAWCGETGRERMGILGVLKLPGRAVIKSLAGTGVAAQRRCIQLSGSTTAAMPGMSRIL